MNRFASPGYGTGGSERREEARDVAGGPTRVYARVTGLVQGVGYRYFAMQLARRYGITGWVKNRDDGSVELEAEGADEAIEAFVERLGVGPRGADVAGVSVERRDPTNAEKTFVVRSHDTFE